MAELKNREANPIPGVEYSEIHIPDEKEMGTGSFSTVLEPKALSKNNPIISSIQKTPVFLLIVSINIAIEEVSAMIGESHDKPPRSRKVFVLPEKIKSEDANDFTVNFRDWEIEDIKLNGAGLTLVE
jgi:hypothetical protein